MTETWPELPGFHFVDSDSWGRPSFGLPAPQARPRLDQVHQTPPSRGAGQASHYGPLVTSGSFARWTDSLPALLPRHGSRIVELRHSCARATTLENVFTFIQTNGVFMRVARASALRVLPPGEVEPILMRALQRPEILPDGARYAAHPHTCGEFSPP
jgi:hypothetical protein